jgi:hypothetical protein
VARSVEEGTAFAGRVRSGHDAVTARTMMSEELMSSDHVGRGAGARAVNDIEIRRSWYVAFLAETPKRAKIPTATTR